jgi:hypothetical protein
MITAGDDPAIVTMEMPAFTGFNNRVLSLAPHESKQILFGPTTYNTFSNLQMDTIQNKILPPNSLAGDKYNRGIHFTSTTPVSIYYQVDSYNSKDMFALKGSKALGLEFYTPFQTLFKTNTSYPDGYPQFHVVATQDNTTVSITPKADIVGTNAGVTKTVVLNRGETFAARAKTFMQDGRLAGSHVVADKPVAVTVCDDLLSTSGAADVTGDQIVPVEGLGTAYVVIRGFATTQNTNYCDKIFILATENNTEVSINNGTATTLGAGQQLIHTMQTALTAVITSNHPVYVYQLSGYGNSSNGTELGAVLLPSMYSIGSRRIIFYKSSVDAYNHNVFVLVRSGNEGAFTVNGSSTVLQASDFTTVPGMTDWKYARKNISSVSSGYVSVSNTTGAFSLGYFYTGATGGASASFGYFSAFGTFEFAATTYMCSSSVTLAGGYARSYEWYFGGELVGTEPSYEATEEGLYTLVMDQDGVSVTASTTVVRVEAGTISPAAQYFCTAPAASVPLTVVGAVTPDDTDYQWQSSEDGVTWTNIPGATSPGYTPLAQTQTLYYRRGMSSTYCGWAYTDASPFALLEVAGSQGNTCQWQRSTDGATWIDIPSATLATYQPPTETLPHTSPGSVTLTTYYRRGTTASACPMVYTASVAVSVSPCAIPVNPHLRSRP